MLKKKMQLEYALNASQNLIWGRIANPDGLAQWFADDVDIQGNEFTFIWKGFQQKAEMVHKKDFKFIRFKWLDEEDPEAYFEFKLISQELTNQLTLIVTDFAYPEDMNDSMDLWNSQINELKRGIGLLV